MANEYDIAESPTLMIIKGPYPLQHEGRLRKTGTVAGTRKHGTNYSRRRQNMTPCGHFAMYAYVIFVPDGTQWGFDNGWVLGIQFIGGKKFWYPHTVSPGEDNPYFGAIKNAESGSYWTHDNLVDQPLGADYVEF
jgi:hypothetical protein